MPDPDDRPVFPPDIVVRIKALACELPRESGLPLSRYSTSEIASEAIRRGIVAEISGATIWRWLNQDAIRPWQFRSWIFPRDPRFEEKAGPVLDLYQGLWHGVPLRADDMVICADEKPSIQARLRKHVPRGPRPRQAMRVEHEYERRGALCYFAAWDVRHAKLFGHCATKSGIAPFNQLVGKVMDHEPYRSASRVFWIVDNGSSHRGRASIERLQGQWPLPSWVRVNSVPRPIPCPFTGVAELGSFRKCARWPRSSISRLRSNDILGWCLTGDRLRRLYITRPSPTRAYQPRRCGRDRRRLRAGSWRSMR